MMAGIDRFWEVENIQRELGCAKKHAYRVIKGLYVEDKITRKTLGSNSGRPRYAYAEQTFCTYPNTHLSEITELPNCFLTE